MFDAKRLIGRKFDDIEVQSDVKHFPFKVFPKDGKPYIRVEYRGEEKEFVSCLIASWFSLGAKSTSSRLKKFLPWFFSR